MGFQRRTFVASRGIDVRRATQMKHVGTCLESVTNPTTYNMLVIIRAQKTTPVAKRVKSTKVNACVWAYRSP